MIKKSGRGSSKKAQLQTIPRDKVAEIGTLYSAPTMKFVYTMCVHPGPDGAPLIASAPSYAELELKMAALMSACNKPSDKVD